ncbi:MFS general substrate transporter [Trichodelitschia bisporula]|uniref:MFS general substrate transporter n=1 Tax=Trichodelitschia bisporula TaxID=703511 RepID=A0A6G1I5M8_9PEZI|nr:MFS general substrate transporter [Trichodelitschia bisporula]
MAKEETQKVLVPEEGGVDLKEVMDEKDRVRTVEHTPSLDGEGLEPVETNGGMTRAKWLACIALCFSYTTSFQQNSCTAAILKQIDEALGPTTYYNWMLTAYTIAVSVSLPISGGLSDIFGRKKFFLVGCTISLIGTVVALASQNVPMMIAAMALKGIGAGSQQLALAAIAEIVPNKHRGHAQAALDIVTLPWAVFGPLTGNAMVKYHKLSFRINFIIGAILNVISIVTAILWYHPPAGGRIVGKSQIRRVRELDWMGIFLMAVGIVLTLMGINFGGETFPWKSAGVISPLVIGLLCLVALGFWEWKVATNPFFAHELFIGNGRTFSLFLVITFVGGMSLYAAAAFWTQQCQGMFFRDPIKIGVSSIPGGVGGAIGGFLGGMLIGKVRFLSSNLMLMYGVAIKMIADGIFMTITPLKFKLALGAGFLAMFGVGFMLVALIVCTQLACKDKNIGLATLVLGSVRAMGGSVAVTIFTSIIHNTIKEDAGPRVGKVVVPMGVPVSSLPALVPLVIAGKDQKAAMLEGLTPELVKVTRDTLKWSWSLAFQRIYVAAIIFSAVALVAAFFARDVTHNMTDNVAVQLQNDTPNEKKKEETMA